MYLQLVFKFRILNPTLHDLVHISQLADVLVHDISMPVLVVFILLLFIVPNIFPLLCGRPERFHMATRDHEDSDQPHPHGNPSGASRQEDMLPETTTFDDSLSSTARKAAETWVTAPVTPNSVTNSPSMRVNRTLTALVAASLVGSAQAYECTSNAQCKYQGCNGYCRPCSYYYSGNSCNNDHSPGYHCRCPGCGDDYGCNYNPDKTNCCNCDS